MAWCWKGLRKMNSYTEFAKIYDALMKPDIDYEKVADFVENIFALHEKTPDMLVDLACGTGNLTIPLSKRGYDMIGVDKSADMLSIAREKDGGEDILFLNQDMTRLDLYGTADAFLCMVDGVNYCIDTRALFSGFEKIRKCFLNPGGLVIFDISSEYKLKNVIGNETFIHNDERIFYSWENTFHEKLKLSDMYLNFFVKEGKLYRRFSERHLQRAYSRESLEKLLARAGFSRVTVYDGFTLNSPREDSQRLVFVAE